MLAVGLFAACGDPDVAPIPTFDGVANTTIAELLAMHEITSTNSYNSNHQRTNHDPRPIYFSTIFLF